MHLYVSHSSNYDYEHELYQPLLSALGESHKLFLPHLAENVSTKAKDVISATDYVIAEVTLASTGQGIELGWASAAGVPIVCFYKQGTKISGSLHFVTNLIFSYTTPDDLIGQLHDLLAPKRMSAVQVLEHFKVAHPGKTAVCLPNDKPLEIICELEPTTQHANYSVAVAAINKSQAHYHKKITETYQVLCGKLTLHIDNKTLLLEQGDSVEILPGQTHWAEGDFTFVKVTSFPGWTPDDHYLM